MAPASPSPSPTLSGLLADFEASYLPARNFAELTRSTYLHAVRAFVGWAEPRDVCSPADVGLRTLDAFLAHLDGRGLAGSTRRKYVYALKLFFAYLESRGHVPVNVALKVVPPETEVKDSRVLTAEEYRGLRDQVRLKPRDAAIVEVMLQTGVRLGELARLRIDDVYVPKKISAAADNAGSLTVVQGKGRKDRTIALNHRACEAIAAWLLSRPADAPTRWLFLNKYKRPMGARSIQKMLAKHFEAADIKLGHPHALRHTFGTHAVKTGVSLRVVQEMLGHKNLATTSRYVSLAREQMDKEMQTHAL